MIGRTLSHYRVISEIGRGGMGVVFRALDLKLKREVALKVLAPELVADPDRRRRFLREAQTAASLKHPNVAVVYEVGESAGVAFLTMELIEGAKLSERIERGAVAQTEALGLGHELLDGLAHAHDRGVVHRDLKPANILVTSDGHPKIIDFGLAKLLDSDGGAASNVATAIKEQTAPARVMGTFGYMSPEQALGGKVDARSDVFSLGIVLYELLTGRHPFSKASALEIPYVILHDEPPPMDSLGSGGFGLELSRILKKCLAKDPSARYASAREVLADWARLRAGAESPARVSRKTRWAAGLGAGLTAFAVLAAVWLLGKDKQTPMPRIVRTVQITNAPGLELEPALSPDGKLLAYAKGPIGHTQIFVQQVTGGRPISVTEGFPGTAYRPRWSPDGTRIAFATFLDGTESVYVVPALGGTPRLAVEDGADIAWSADGKDILFLSFHGGIYRRAVEGGAVAERLAESGADEWSSLAWSPDESRIAFAAGSTNYLLNAMGVANLAPSSIEVLPAGDGRARAMTDNLQLNQSPVWAPDGDHLLFVSSRGGSRDIYELSVRSPTSPPKRWTTGLNVHTISLAKDGKRLAYSVLTTRQNVWSLPIPENGPVSVLQATPVTTGNQIVEGMDVSSDGQWLVFDSNRSGNQDIYKIPLAGGEPVQLTTDPGDDFHPAFSPDGKRVVFYSFRTGNRDLFVMTSDGGDERQLTRDEGTDQYPDWSPDGLSIAFGSSRSGRHEVYAISPEQGELDGSTPVQMTPDGGNLPKWSPDGKSVAYTGISILDVASGRSRYLGGCCVPGWSSDGRTIYYLRRSLGERESGIYSIPVTGGEPALVVRFDDPSRLALRPEWAVAAGKFYFTLTEHESDIWMMELEPQD